jgi:hypothetical protein
VSCSHDWIYKEGKLKERCSKCGAARVYDPNQCSHNYVKQAGSNKERCTKCGAARVVLDIDNLTVNYASDEVK